LFKPNRDFNLLQHFGWVCVQAKRSFLFVPSGEKTHRKQSSFICGQDVQNAIANDNTILDANPQPVGSDNACDAGMNIPIEVATGIFASAILDSRQGFDPAGPAR
jgi:hypothetical protein